MAARMQNQKLRRAAVSTGVTTPAQDAQVLAMLHDLEVGEHGAEVAMTMHQEKPGAVPTSAFAVSAPAATVLRLCGQRRWMRWRGWRERERIS